MLFKKIKRLTFCNTEIFSTKHTTKKQDKRMFYMGIAIPVAARLRKVFTQWANTGLRATKNLFWHYRLL